MERSFLNRNGELPDGMIEEKTSLVLRDGNWGWSMRVFEIKSKEDAEEFQKYNDETGISFKLKLEKCSVTDTGRGYWSSKIIDPSKTLLPDIFTGRYGEDSFSCSVAETDTIGRPSRIVFGYDNMYANISIIPESGTYRGNIRFSHLYKNNVHTFPVYANGSDLYMEFPWHIVYSEVKRINKRNLTNKKKKEIKKLESTFKFMSLHGQLITDGIDCVDSHEWGIQTKYLNGNSITITLDKKAKYTDLSEDNEYDMSLFGHTTKKVKYPRILEVLTAFQTFYNVVRKKDTSHGTV